MRYYKTEQTLKDGEHTLIAVFSAERIESETPCAPSYVSIDVLQSHVEHIETGKLLETSDFFGTSTDLEAEIETHPEMWEELTVNEFLAEGGKILASLPLAL